VIAAQHAPFKAHAWVEVEGKVVNDSQEVQALYAVLDRF
jgi:Transglutaminase-like superfamily